LAVLVFELKASYLQYRHFTTWAMLPALLYFS
jgi:hypothetical protein